MNTPASRSSNPQATPEPNASPSGAPRTSSFTRRDFLAATALTAAALTPGAGLVRSAKAVPGPLPAPLRRNSLSTLRIGLVGCGGRGTGAALQAIGADPDAVLYAVADAVPDRLDSGVRNLEGALRERDEDAGDDRFSRRIDVPRQRRFVGLESHRELIDSGVDVVLLCTPPVFRPRQLADAVAAGKHVFCEKPVAIDGPGVRSVLESARIAKENRLALVSGFCWRYSTRERDIYRQIHEGAIGDLVAVYTTYNATGWIEPKPRKPEWSDMEFQLRNWHYFNFISGDHIVEQAVHAIDKIHWAFNSGEGPSRLPERVVAVGGRQVRPDVPETGNVYDNFALAYEYANGVRAFHMCRHWPNSPSDNSDYVMGTKGTATVNGWTDTHVITGPNAWRSSAQRNDMYQTEHDELFASIRADRPINDGVQMSESTLMAIMGRMAAYTGQSITWEQALASQEDLLPARWEWTDRPVTPMAVPGTTKFL